MFRKSRASFKSKKEFQNAKRFINKILNPKQRQSQFANASENYCHKYQKENNIAVPLFLFLFPLFFLHYSKGKSYRDINISVCEKKLPDSRTRGDGGPLRTQQLCHNRRQL